MPDRDNQDGSSQPPTTTAEPAEPARTRASEPTEHLSGDSSHTRRQVLKTGGAVGVLAAIGATFLYSGGSESAAATPLPEGVPETADVAAHSEIAQLLTDQSFQQAVDDQLDEQGVGVDLTTVLDTIDETTGIDPRSVETVAGFATVANDGGGAMLVETDRPAEAVHDALAASGVLGDVTDEAGHELYEIRGPGSLWLGSLGDGEFALGGREDIAAIIAVRAGDVAGIRSELNEAVAEAGEGVLQFGAVVPDDPFESLGLPTVGEQFVEFDELEYAYGTIENGDLLLTVQTTSTRTAEDMASLLDTAALLIEDNADRLGLPAEIEASIIDILGEMTAEADGDAVEVTLPDGVRLVAVVGSVLLGTNQSASV